MVTFIALTFVFFLCSNNHQRFRYDQNLSCIDIYKVIPNNYIELIREYYDGLYQKLFVSERKSDGI